MDLRHALLAALAAVPLTACPSTWNCKPDDEDFSVNEPISAEEIDGIVSAWGYASWDEVTCENACRDVYRRVRGWEAADIDSCELTLPDNPDGTGAAGRVVCAGRGIEYYCEGRRPLGHVEAEVDDCVAAMASLEAASVVAFERLAAQLEGLGAPPALIDRCRAAADDERDHARWLTTLAERRGAAVPNPRSEPAHPSLVELARHNAVEGCVHESFAALIAMTRARLAPDPVLRRVFAKIAADETRHGQLAWDLHAWLRTQLDAEQLAEVEGAQREALARLPARARALADASRELGTPPPAASEALAREFGERLAA